LRVADLYSLRGQEIHTFGQQLASMENWNFSRSVAGTRPLIDTGVDHGLRVQQCLVGTGLRETDLEDARGLVTAEQELRVIRNLLRQLPKMPALGVEAGLRYHYTTFGMLGFAWVTSSTSKEALEIALRYFNLTYAFTRFEVSETEDDILVTLDTSKVPDDVNRFIVERDTAALVTVQRELVSQAQGALSRLEFTFRASGDASAYKEAYGVEPEFGRPKNVVVFDRERLLLPLPQANELVRQNSAEACVQLLDRYRSRSGLSAKVRERLARNIGLDMEDIARDLFMTSRTLRRQLSDEGASFHAIRDEVRMALAEELLTALKLSVDETAYRLGYSSSTSFIAAFKRATGDTPTAYKRKSVQGGGHRDSLL